MLGLPNLISVVVRVEAGFNNLTYSSVEVTIDYSEVLLADTT